MACHETFSSCFSDLFGSLWLKSIARQEWLRLTVQISSPKLEETQPSALSSYPLLALLCSFHCLTMA